MAEVLRAVLDSPTSAIVLVLGVCLLAIAIIGQIPKLLPELTGGRRLGLGALGLAAAIVGVILGWPEPPLLLPEPAPRALFTITKIDGIPKAPQEACETGYEVRLEGSVVESPRKGYVVVKPLEDRHWYIQAPGPIVLTGENNTKWHGTAYLGEKDRGIGDRFAIFTVATSEDYRGEQSLNSEPKGTKSGTLVCKRVR